MKVVSQKTGVDTKAGLQNGAFVGHTVAIGVAKTPQIGDAGEEHITIRRHHAGRHSVQSCIESRSKHRRPIRAAIAVGVFDEPHLVGGLVKPFHAAFKFSRPFFIHAKAIVRRLQLEIVLQQKRASSIFFGPQIEAIFLRHENSIAFIQANRHRRSQFWLGREQIDCQPRGYSKRRHLLLSRVSAVR